MAIWLTGSFHRPHILTFIPPPVLRSIWHLPVLWWHIKFRYKAKLFHPRLPFPSEVVTISSWPFLLLSSGTSVSSPQVSPVNKGDGGKISWLISGDTNYFHSVDYFKVYTCIKDTSNPSKGWSSLSICEAGSNVMMMTFPWMVII